MTGLSMSQGHKTPPESLPLDSRCNAAEATLKREFKAVLISQKFLFLVR